MGSEMVRRQARSSTRITGRREHHDLGSCACHVPGPVTDLTDHHEPGVTRLRRSPGPGTERARFLGLPTAQVRFARVPGYLAAGTVRCGSPHLPEGLRMAMRGVAHRSLAVAPVESVHPLPEGVAFEDAAVWQLALTAMLGLALGEHRDGEPLTVAGAGLLGAITRREPRAISLARWAAVLPAELLRVPGALGRVRVRPQVVCGSGEQGVPGREFDRIFVSYTVERVPTALVEQLAPEGKLLAHVTSASPSWPGASLSSGAPPTGGSRRSCGPWSSHTVPGTEWRGSGSARTPVLGAADPAAGRPLRPRRTALTSTTPPFTTRTRSDLWESPGLPGPSTTTTGGASGGSVTRRRACSSSTPRPPRAAARSTSAAGPASCPSSRLARLHRRRSGLRRRRA
ncbi:hypothetical protein ABZX90_09440 [Streptomyces sp. NPDC002935]|uniref:hypothetical protein n=1 Tax=Streptomyces sp. NPDC002935 TaxID=3154545 RepID=UPI0033AA438B